MFDWPWTRLSLGHHSSSLIHKPIKGRNVGSEDLQKASTWNIIIARGITGVFRNYLVNLEKA